MSGFLWMILLCPFLIPKPVSYEIILVRLCLYVSNSKMEIYAKKKGGYSSTTPACHAGGSGLKTKLIDQGGWCQGGYLVKTQM